MHDASLGLRPISQNSVNLIKMPEFSNKIVADVNVRNSFLGSKAASYLNGNSPFVDGLVLSGLTIDVAQSAWDGAVVPDARPKLLFHTAQGIDFPMTMLTAKKLAVDADGKLSWVEPVGSFNAKVASLLASNANLTVNELASQLIAAAPNGIRVKRTPYTGLAKDNRRYPAALVNFDIV